jgi:alkylglycerol monooxygenase
MDEGLNWAAAAIPVFLGATVIEAWIGKRRGKRLYSFGTAISDLACGSVFQAVELLIKLATLGVYVWLFEHHRLVDWGEHSWVPWLLGMVGVDFLFYWWHRVSHVVNVMWAVHGVHHQSEDYNLAVALRQPIFEPITWFLFYGVLALLGVPPLVYLLGYAVNRFYQFWIHTELVDKAGSVAEAVLNTPSHHRVHHGVDEKYLDRNYGAILIVWDRLFGTFQPEEQHPTYGTTIPLRSYNPLWANVQHLARCWTLAKLATRWRDKLWVWFAHPAWLPEGVKDPAVKPDRSAYEKYNPYVPRPLKRYILLHFVLAGSAMGVVVFFEHSFSVLQLAAASAVMVAAFGAFLGLVEGKRWARPLELARLAGFVLVSHWLLTHVSGLGATTVQAITAGTAALCALSLLLLRPAPRQ